MKYLLCCAFLILLAKSLSGQMTYFKHYQVENGLANNTVYAVFQDSRGFMWFGTKEGLNRFDGTVFKTFSIDLPQKLDNREFIYTIAEGIDSTIWVGTRNGVYGLDPRTGRFRLLQGSVEGEVLGVQADKSANIWIRTNIGVFRYNETRKKIFRYRFSPAGPSDISAIEVDGTGRVTAASGDGRLFEYDKNKDEFRPLNKQPISGLTGNITKVLHGPGDNLIIGTTEGVGIYEIKTNSFRNVLGRKVDHRRVYVRDLLAVSKDEIWIASESGIYRLSLSRGMLPPLRQDELNPYSLSDNAVYTLFKDTESGIWCGTYFGGVNYHHSQLGYFQKYFRSGSLGFSGNAIRELFPDGNGNLWVGTEDAGLNRLNIHTGKTERFEGPSKNDAHNVHSLMIDKDELWIGSFQRGLDVMNLNTLKYVRHYDAQPDKNGLKSNFIISSLKSRSGELYFGTAHGVYIYNRRSDRFLTCGGFPDNSYVFSLLEDSRGKIWAGTIGKGLYSFDPVSKATENYRYSAKDKNSLSSNSICGIFEDQKGKLWLSTEGGGLCKFNGEAGAFTRYSTLNGLPSNMVYKVLEDGRGNLWVSTSRGLAAYSPQTGAWKVFTKADGLLTDQFNYSSAYRAPDGEMFFGSVKGLIGFNPELSALDKKTPKIYITSFKTENHELQLTASDGKASIDFARSVSVAYDQFPFSISFSALTYIAGPTISYVYRMDGLDKKWVSLSTDQRVSYTRLPPGRYRFRVRTIDSEGKLQQNERGIDIIILPPWWRSSPAYLVYIALLFLTLYLAVNEYYRRRRQRHKRRMLIFNQQKEKEIYRAKIEFFTNVAHEIRTPLTLIKGPLEMVIDAVGELESVREDLISIEKNTDRLVVLTTQLLDFRSTEHNGYALNFVKTDIIALLQENIDIFRPLLKKRMLGLETEFLQQGLFAFVDLEALRKIISNLMDNAAKYAETFIAVRISLDGAAGNFTIEFSNDGHVVPGHLAERIFEPFYRIDPEIKQGSGIGLPLARALADMHNGTLEFMSPRGNLNIFVLTLPVHQQIEFKLKSDPEI